MDCIPLDLENIESKDQLYAKFIGLVANKKNNVAT